MVEPNVEVMEEEEEEEEEEVGMTRMAGTMERGEAGVPSPPAPSPLKAQNKGVPGAKSRPVSVTTVPPPTGP